MASKQEWRDYFKLVNDREPTIDEYRQAVKNGEVDEVKPAQSASSETQAVAAQAGISSEIKSDMSNLTGAIKDGSYKDLLSPDKGLNQSSLFRLGCFGGATSTIVSIISAIIGFATLGSISSGLGSYLSNWAASNSNDTVQYSFNSSQYQSIMNGVTTAATVIAVVSLIVGIGWTWFTIYRLKSRQFKGWSIYFLVIGIIGVLGAVMSLVSSLSTFSTYTALMNEVGIKYGVYMTWSVISTLLSAAVNVVWILIFVKSRKIN